MSGMKVAGGSFGRLDKCSPESGCSVAEKAKSDPIPQTQRWASHRLRGRGTDHAVFGAERLCNKLVPDPSAEYESEDDRSNPTGQTFPMLAFPVRFAHARNDREFHWHLSMTIPSVSSGKQLKLKGRIRPPNHATCNACEPVANLNSTYFSRHMS